MQDLVKQIKKNLDERLLLISVSNPRNAQEIKKYTIRPVQMKGELLFQVSAFTKTKVFHENFKKEMLEDRLFAILPSYKQVLVKTLSGEFSALINKHGKAAVKIRPVSGSPQAKSKSADIEERLSHNRKKKYILEEGKKVPFLVDLGVMTKEGNIVQKKYDKFRQINRFLEFIRDVVPYLPKDREITILDFGCGKSYLTFAMYYYLNVLKGYEIRIVGLDLKEDVIRDCRRLAKKYGYDNLHFLEGAIEDYEGLSQVDMVVTLHACDTATDYALYKAVKWNAKVILSVPCCQHELNLQYKKAAGTEFEPIADYGILKERFCALATDGVRAKILESKGYETQILEFIDMEHTPKNLLIRAVRTKPLTEVPLQEAKGFCEKFGFRPSLLTLLEEDTSC